ncbi:MAG: hypothetical protein MEP57_09710 [Microvirga sp.]|nr:hypothetical protein [Microvirga sp.]
MILMRSLLAATALALCAIAPAQSSDLTVGFTLDADTLDPANHRKRETETIIRNLYDGLVTRDPDMVVVPEIAESMTQQNPTVYDFKIRSGAMVLRPLLREQGLHETGICGFVVDGRNVPGLAEAEAVEIYDADTNVRIYRRRRKGSLVEQKLFRLELQVLGNAALNGLFDDAFHLAYTRLDRLPEETAKSIIGVPFSSSIYVTGRVALKVYDPLLKDRGFVNCAYLRDPFVELSEQLLLLQWAGMKPRSAVKGVLTEGIADVVEFGPPPSLKDAGDYAAWLEELPRSARGRLADPACRLLTTFSVDDGLGPNALADALDALANFAAVGHDEDLAGFTAMVGGAMGDEFEAPDIGGPSQRVMDLANDLRNLETFRRLLAADMELYAAVRECYGRATLKKA